MPKLDRFNISIHPGRTALGRYEKSLQPSKNDELLSKTDLFRLISKNGPFAERSVFLSDNTMRTCTRYRSPGKRR